MQKKDFAPFIWRIARTVLIADLVFAILVGITCFVLDLQTLEAYGTLLVWVGTGVLVLTALMGIGGVASRSQDIQAFSLSGAGDMSENLKRIAEAGQSSLGCFIQFILISISLIVLGYLIQFASFLL